MNKIPVYLITGFLGSGKTTLIKRLIDTCADNLRVAVVQNEFAPASFDGNELKRLTNKQFHLLEVNNGSVFCVCLLSGFIRSLSKFVNDYAPEIVLLEASGLSDPVTIGELFGANELQERTYLAGSICIVDPASFLKMEKLQQRIVHQVQVADQIIINKIDLSGDVGEVVQKIRQVNPLGKIQMAKYCDVRLDDIMDMQRNELFPRPSFTDLAAQSSGRPDIKSAVFRTTKPLKKENVSLFFNAIMPHLIRLKGYILLDSGNFLAVQVSQNILQTESINKSVSQTEIIAMGYEMTAGDIGRVYKQYS